jgi:tRNA 2-thiouridine synthesizing protein A
MLDCRRLLCPMPVIRVQNMVAQLPAGTRLEAICTDPGALNDIPAWCRINGHRVVETRQVDQEYVVVVEVGESE